MPTRSLVISLLSFFLLPASLPAQNRPLGFPDVIELKAPRELTISTNGRHIAFTLRDVDWKQSRFRSHLWVLNTQTRNRRQFTFGEASESSPAFSPSGEWLAFLTSRKSGMEDPGDEASGRQLWIIPVDGGEARKLTSVRGGVQDFSWSSQGSRIFLVVEETLDEGTLARREQRRKERFDEVEYLKTQYRNEIWGVDVEDGSTERIYAGMKGLAAMKPSPDGGRFVFTSNQTGLRKDSPLTDIWIYDVASRQVRQLTTRAGSESDPTWSPDGRSILFRAPQDPDTSYSQSEYFLISSNGGALRNLTESLDRSPSSAVFVNGGSQLLMTVQDGVYTRLHRLDLESGQITPILDGSIDVGNLSYAAESKQFVVTQQTVDTLPEIYLASLDESAPKKLTNFSEQLQGYRLGKQEVISWTSKDGLEIEGILNYPVDYRPGRRVPLIVNPHGGPHGRYQNTFQGEYQVWANRGYATLSPNFRGSSGYGAAFDVANKRDIGFGDYEDVMSGTDKVIEMGVADPDRMGVQGGSYGGYMTNWVITHTDRFKAAVSKYGIWHILTDFSNSYSPRWEYNYLEVPYWDDWELWQKHSPGSYSKNVETPVLIMHGDADPNTVLSNSREMFTALWLQDKAVEFVIYPREGHGISGEPNHILDRQIRVLEWWDKYLLGGESPTLGDVVSNVDWDLKVLAMDSNARGQKEGTSRVKILLEVKNRKAERRDLELDLSRDVYLQTSDQREISALGLITNTGDNQWLLTPGPATLSQNAVYWLQLVFEIPDDLTTARIRFKDFPTVRLEF